MIQINPGSINDLLTLKKTGVPVTMTSHPGNASLYKLTLWHCGIPEHFWDITCSVADANNWPMFRLQNGEAELLVDEELHRTIMRETTSSKRFVTAYQKTKTGERLGRVHVRTCERLFPGVISSCSRLLLRHIERVKEVFTYLAKTRRQEVFSRFITDEGALVPLQETTERPVELVDSFERVLRELDHLLFEDTPIETVGGACYDGIMVPLSTMLAGYWEHGSLERYDISGPDMIHYATRPGHQEKLSEMLSYLHLWNPKLVPRRISVRMLPGVVARVGYVRDHVSEEIMERKRDALSWEKGVNGDYKRAIYKRAGQDELLWPIKITQDKEKYFSQHDLLLQKGQFMVDTCWKSIPLESLRETLARVNTLLKVK